MPRINVPEEAGFDAEGINRWDVGHRSRSCIRKSTPRLPRRRQEMKPRSARKAAEHGKSSRTRRRWQGNRGSSRRRHRKRLSPEEAKPEGEEKPDPEEPAATEAREAEEAKAAEKSKEDSPTRTSTTRSRRPPNPTPVRRPGSSPSF